VGREAGQRLQGPDWQDREAQLRQVTREFEALFLEILLKQARRATEGLGGGQGSLARQIYRDWFDQQVAQQVAAVGGTGLGEVLYRHLAARYLSGAEEGGAGPGEDGAPAGGEGLPPVGGAASPLVAAGESLPPERPEDGRESG